MKISIETNTYSVYSRGDNKLKKVILDSDAISISTISLGELYLGFKEGSKESENLEKLKVFLSDIKVRISKINPETSRHYSNIKYALRRKGDLIPENDIWIAASALETDTTLVTYDRHFLKVPGLKLWKGLK